MRMAGGGAVRDHRHRLARRMAGIVVDLDVQDGRKPAQPLRADAQRVDLVENLDAQLLDVVLRPARLQFAHVDGRSEEHTSELQSLMRISYAVFCLKKKKKNSNSVEKDITYTRTISK